MIKTLSIVVLLMNMSPVLLASETNLIYFGGGGEPKDALTTQFDETARGLGEFYKANKNYSTTVSFNGGHPVTEGIIKDKFKGAKIEERFTVSSYKSVIQETIEKLSKNPPEIPEGGKILIFIDSHGGEKSGKTHSISTTAAALTNMNNVSDGTSASLDALEELTKLAEAKNVKLAIVDGSCHAGNSLPLANSKTCVISASGPKHYAYSTFTNAFVTQMKKGKNLEDVFLETREQLNGLGFPMISTPEGMSVQDEIYPALTPYMYYHDEYRGMALDKIDDYFRENNSDEQVCRREKEYDSLKAVLSLIEDINMVEKNLFLVQKLRCRRLSI